MSLRFSKIVPILALLLSAFFISCSNDPGTNPNPVVPNSMQTPMNHPGSINPSVSAPQPMNSMGTSTNTDGSGGDMPAYYDHQLFTINFKEFPAGSEATLISRNGQLNNIYQSDPGLPGGKPFISVIDAIPGDGMNPLWLEVQIAFTPGHTPRQLFSDDEINAAAASGEITLSPTSELYRCSVVGTK